MTPPVFTFRVHPARLAVARLAPGAPLPGWARGGFTSVTRTAQELSIVCAEEEVPAAVVQSRGKVALGIEGTLALDSIGVLAALCARLAEARVPVFALSTFDTDWLLVPAERFEAARAALMAAGHRVEGEPPAI